MKITLNLPGLALILLIAGPSHGAKTQDRQAEASDDHSEVTIGLALNGGSYTASNACGGFMRGFQQQKVTINGEQRPGMEAFDLVSGLSGGNVPNMLYHYAPFTTSDEILDATGISDPSMMTMEGLEVIPENSMFTQFITSPFSNIAKIAAIVIATNATDIYPIMSSFTNLQPFGIASGTKMDYARIRHDVKSTPLFSASMVGPLDAYPNFVYNQMSRGFLTDFADTYENRLERYGMELDEKYQMNNDYLMELVEKNGYKFPIPAFATHEGVEVPFVKKASLTVDNFENMTIDAVEFEPVDATYAELSSKSDPFTIEKTLGMATDISVLTPGFWDLIGQGLIPPSMQDPINVDIPTADGGKREMVFTDGGYNDGCGVPLLVNKKMKKIVSVSAPPPGIAGLDTGGPELASSVRHQLKTCISGYFGLHPYRDPQRLKDAAASPDPLPFRSALDFFDHIFNVTGSNGENHYNTLVDNLTSLQAAGEPMITTLKNIEVVDNPFYGIEGGWTLDFTIILNVGIPDKFAAQIPDGIVTPPPGRDLIEHTYFTNEAFATVPNVVQATPGVDLSLPVAPARMTQIMNSWMIAHAWEDPLIGDDGKEKFGGFKKLLEGTTTSKETNQTPKSAKAKKATKAPKRRRKTI